MTNPEKIQQLTKQGEGKATVVLSRGQTSPPLIIIAANDQDLQTALVEHFGFHPQKIKPEMFRKVRIFDPDKYLLALPAQKGKVKAGTNLPRKPRTRTEHEKGQDHNSPRRRPRNHPRSSRPKP